MTLRLLAASLTAVLLCGCAARRSGDNTVVIYVSADQAVAQPILENFGRANRLTIQAVYETADRGTGLVNRLIAERDNPQADVYWASEPVHAEMLKQQGISEPYFSPNSVGIPNQFKDPDGHWTGFSARARVILAKRDLAQRPEGMAAYADPSHRGKAVIANPLSGPTTAQMAALFTIWGDERAKAFLDAMKRNEVRITASDRQSADLVVAGTADFAVVDSSDAVSRLRRYREVELIFPDQREDGPGVLIVPNTLVLVRGARHLENAKLLIDDLLSRETQRRLAFEDCAQIPLHAGIETPPEIRRIEALRTMKVDFAAVARKMAEIQPLLKAWTAR